MKFCIQNETLQYCNTHSHTNIIYIYIYIYACENNIQNIIIDYIDAEHSMYKINYIIIIIKVNIK